MKTFITSSLFQTLKVSRVESLSKFSAHLYNTVYKHLSGMDWRIRRTFGMNRPPPLDTDITEALVRIELTTA